MTQTSGERRIASWLVPVRSVVRKARLLRVYLLSGAKVHVGKNFSIGRNAQILSPHYFRAGDDVRIANDLLCEVDVTIGNGVLISSRVCFIGDDHAIPPAGLPIYPGGGMPEAQIHLAGDNLVGNGVTILGSVTVGSGAVIGAGSLVLHDVPPNAIVVGRPARLLRMRQPVDKATESQTRR